VSKKSTPTFSGLQNTSSNTELSFDYSEIKGELKKIAVLAIAFFAILIALSFFIK